MLWFFKKNVHFYNFLILFLKKFFSVTDKRKDNLENDTNYKFTRAFDPASSQKEIFDTTSRPLVDRLVEGGDGLLFAYGITGSGKTYTMMGSKKEPGILPRTLNMLFNSIESYQTKECEVIPTEHNTFTIQSPMEAMEYRQENLNQVTKYSKANDSFFSEEKFNFDVGHCSSKKVEHNVRYAVFVQFVEIYNDRVYDLLVDRPR